MKRSKVIAALLCAVMLAAAALPALALSGTRYTNADLNSIGVHALCTSKVTLVKATAMLELTYLPDPSNHMPESDYTCKAWVDVEDDTGNGVYYHPTYVVGMSTTTVKNIASLSFTPYVAIFQYFVNETYWNSTTRIK